MTLETSVRGRELTTKFTGRDLSRREWQVLTLTAQGLITKEIGTLLGKLSSRTIEIHKEHCMEKLGARNTAHAVAIAIGGGIISLDTEIPEEEYTSKRSGRRPKLRDASAEDAAKWLKNGGRLS